MEVKQMQAKQTMVIISIVLATALLMFTMFAIRPAPVEMSVIPECPTVVIPEVTIPDFPDTRLSLRQDLKSEAIDVCDDEFDMDDVEDLYDEDDEVVLVREYKDDRDYSSIRLGIDNTDDREITVERVYKVEVEPDLDDDYKDKVYVTCEVTSDDGDLEAEIDYSH